MHHIEQHDKLIRALSRRPGIGRRAAERIALTIAHEKKLLLEPLLNALQGVNDNITTCDCCGVITTFDANPCAICSSSTRDKSIICVVENSDDILTIEKADSFNGVYHTLNGRISPMTGVRPEDLRLKELFERVEKEKISEVILAINTDVEGDATAAYISEKLASLGIKTTRIAFGIPADSGIIYTDPITLKRAFNGRLPATKLNLN